MRKSSPEKNNKRKTLTHSHNFIHIEGTAYTVEDQTIDSAKVQKILKDLKDRPELTQFTLEANNITDVEGMCSVFA